MIVLGTLIFHCGVQVGEARVEPPKMDGRSTTQSFAYFDVIVIEGLLGDTLCFSTLVTIGLVWFTPEKEYAPITALVEPDMVMVMFPVPLGFFRYQNSASLL